MSAANLPARDRRLYQDLPCEIAVSGPPGAEQLYEHAAGLGGPEGEFRLGMLREHEGRFEEAALWYRRAAPRHFGAAWALVELLGDEASEKERRQAADAAYLEGCRLHQQNREEKAEQWLRRAVAHNHAAAVFELSMILSRRGDTAEARRLQRAAARLGGDPTTRAFDDPLRSSEAAEPV